MSQASLTVIDRLTLGRPAVDEMSRGDARSESAGKRHSAWSPFNGMGQSISFKATSMETDDLGCHLFPRANPGC